MDQFSTANGVRIAWEQLGRDAAGLPIVLVHGLGYGRWGWDPVAGPLAATRRVVLLDNRGIGASDVPAVPYTAGQMASDVVGVVEAVGADRIHLVGASLGGMIAQHVALSRPDLVERLVLVCTTPGGDVAHPIPQATLDLIARMPEMAATEAVAAAVDNALGRTEGPARDRIVERIVAHRTNAPQDPTGWQGQAHAGTTHDLGEQVARITCRTLVVHGTADTVVDPRNADVLADLIPDTRVHLMRGAGHLCFWERPDEFVGVVEEFLDEPSAMPDD